MVLGFAVSAFAIHAEIPSETQAVVAKGGTQITLGGEIRTRGWYRDNFSGGLSNSTHSSAWWDERVRLNIGAVVAPGVEGFVQVETHSGTDGDKYKWGNANTGIYQGPSGPQPSHGVLGVNAKPNAYPLNLPFEAPSPMLPNCQSRAAL